MEQLQATDVVPMILSQKGRPDRGTIKDGVRKLAAEDNKNRIDMDQFDKCYNQFLQGTKQSEVQSLLIKHLGKHSPNTSGFTAAGASDATNGNRVATSGGFVVWEKIQKYTGWAATVSGVLLFMYLADNMAGYTRAGALTLMAVYTAAAMVALRGDDW